jgi:methylthioribose-1-phosphate isomerase
MQGARLTAYELKNAGLDVNLICDNMAAHFMSKGAINAVLVGCDRVAANGDTANKIGTLGTAVLAKHFGIPFYVLGPVSTVDPTCKSGADIVVEERNGDEITTLGFTKRIAPEGITCRNPAFDVTPAELITAIVTERGIFRYPYDFSKI